jgi:hypothetical protein
VRVTVTPLGASGQNVSSVASAVVDYLDGTDTSPSAALVGAPRGSSMSSYYADSIEGPGRWMGAGASFRSLEGVVDRQSFQRVLEGRHPATPTAMVSDSSTRPKPPSTSPTNSTSKHSHPQTSSPSPHRSPPVTTLSTTPNQPTKRLTCSRSPTQSPTTIRALHSNSSTKQLAPLVTPTQRSHRPSTQRTRSSTS